MATESEKKQLYQKLILKISIQCSQLGKKMAISLAKHDQQFQKIHFGKTGW